MSGRLAFVCLLGIVVAPAVGCGQKITPDQWSAALEEYAEREQAGGMTALAATEASDGVPGFAVLGGKRPTKGADAVGVLVGVVESAGRPWLVYMLARVEEGKAESLRPAAAGPDEAGVRVVVGEPDDQAWAAYTGATGSLPSITSEAPELRGWPRLHDRFDAAVEGQSVIITEQRSGALWRLDTP
jgi:hypothetical protein